MKNLSLNLAFYHDDNFMGRVATFLSKKLPWFPCASIKLFNHTVRGDKSVVYHEIEFGAGKYYFRWQKIHGRGQRKDPYWRFENLTSY